MHASPKVKNRVNFENIAYRGASGLAPENSLRACDMALRKGASIIEVNVRMTADGIPVLFHDEEVNRKTRGKGRVAGMKLRDLRALRVRGGRGRRIYEEPISTLEEAILLTRGRGILAIEIMGDEDVHPGITTTVVDLVKKYELPPETTILSQSYKVYRALRMMRPPFRVGRVLGPRATWQKVIDALRDRPALLMIHRGAASPKALRMCREAKVKTWVYTIEHQKEFQRAVSLRPEGMVTPYPGRLRRYLEKIAPTPTS